MSDKTTMLNIIGGETPQNLTNIFWTITTRCNYKCHYCLVKKNNIDCDITKLLEINDNKLVGTVNLFGGEPTLHPKIGEIIDSLSHPINLWTNFTQSSTFYKKLMNCDSLKLYITYHHEHTRLKCFIEKLSELRQFSSRIICNIPLSINLINPYFVYESILPYVKKCSIIPIVGIPNYYKNCNEVESINEKNDIFINNELINIRDVLFTYKTVIVKCDRNKFDLNLDVDGMYNLCNFNFTSLGHALNSDLICRNTECYPCYFNMGIKKGLFNISYEY